MSSVAPTAPIRFDSVPEERTRLRPHKVVKSAFARRLLRRKDLFVDDMVQISAWWRESGIALLTLDDGYFIKLHCILYFFKVVDLFFLVCVIKR